MNTLSITNMHVDNFGTAGHATVALQFKLLNGENKIAVIKIQNINSFPNTPKILNHSQ